MKFDDIVLNFRDALEHFEFVYFVNQKVPRIYYALKKNHFGNQSTLREYLKESYNYNMLLYSGIVQVYPYGLCSPIYEKLSDSLKNGLYMDYDYNNRKRDKELFKIVSENDIVAEMEEIEKILDTVLKYEKFWRDWRDGEVE